MSAETPNTLPAPHVQPPKGHRGAPLTFAQAMAYLSVSRNTVTRYRMKGSLVGFRLPGGQWRFWRVGLLAGAPLERTAGDLAGRTVSA